MSVLSHLTQVSRELILRNDELDSIKRSIQTLQNRLDSHFGGALKEHFVFGSITRGTTLPRKYDSESDVDYLIVFKDDSFKPQTYLDRLRRFVEKYYHSSEVKQSHPTIKLLLNHITFELVPAIERYGQYQIPAPSSNYTEWMDTDPLSFSREIELANQRYNFNLKPALRLMKYWNSLNGRPYQSYLLERELAKGFYSGSNLKELFFAMIKSLQPAWNDPAWVKQRIERAQKIVGQAESYERSGYAIAAEQEIKKLIP